MNITNNFNSTLSDENNLTFQDVIKLIFTFICNIYYNFH